MQVTENIIISLEVKKNKLTGMTFLSIVCLHIFQFMFAKSVYTLQS